MAAIKVSVVIGFKDWGAPRLEASARSIMASFGGVQGELIISDYCSADPTTANRVVEAVGARLVRTEGDLVWSRSRALNAGFAAAEGELLISTDADMLFAPGSMERIFEWWADSRSTSFFLQCRDLPQNATEVALATGEPDWPELRSQASLRPRWGMGGMMAIDRTSFAMLRGFDERLHTYGREDMDFAMRCRRAGIRNVWIEDPEVQMFHMWHESALDSLSEPAIGRAAVDANRRIVDSDDSWCRNLSQWHSPLVQPQPLVSFVAPVVSDISAFHAMFSSIQAQSVGEWELIIGQEAPDQDGSLENQLLIDPRVKFVPNKGGSLLATPISAAGLGAGAFVIAADEDCIYPPNFLELQIAAFASGVSMVHCNRIDISGGARPAVKQPVQDRCRGTLYRRTAIAALFDAAPTDFSWSGASDALTKSGCRAAFNDSGVVFRVHSEGTIGLSADEAASWKKEVAAFAPDGFVSRHVKIEAADPDLPAASSFDGTLVTSTLMRDGVVLRRSAEMEGATYRDLATLRNQNIEYTIEVGSEIVPWADAALRRLVTDVIGIAESLEATPVAVAILEAEADFGPTASDQICITEFTSDGARSTSLGALVILEASALERVLAPLRGQVAMCLTWCEEGVGNEI